ncbi:bZIP transcription factor [Cladophialophora carrionii]|uniref:BZIP transcription factor n=1 Tax=Cladophialophora carrionii TaxID=86049 RepID=A0A1C1CNL4_9EURO|nr:bZIP transcription factor [Cladophialophora carrionii]
MAMRTPAAGQQACASTLQSIEPTEGVSSRRLKKREIDRRCQRQARERTKTRIAYLEGLVEDFRRQDSSGQLATLLKQLKEVESERDMMAKTLKDIQKAMETHKSLNLTTEEEMEGKRGSGHEGTRRDRHSSSVSPLADDPPIGLQEDHAELLKRTSPSRNFDLAVFSPAPSLPLRSQDQLFAPEVVPLPGDGQSPSEVLVQAKCSKEPNPMPCNYAENWTAPLSSCSCVGCHQHQPGRRSVWRGNYWRYANEVLSERFDWTEDVAPESDVMCDDVPIRALLEGWDAVASRAPLHPSWQILRRIDETLFAMCPKVERLAILRAMHTLLQFHTESTSERYVRLPPWYMRRPSQKIAHSYAIDYFAWPGVRERFIFNEHDYCGNEFWTLFTTSFKLLWPYEFRDCYTREIETGLYKVSPMFDQRLSDIRCWTMGPDIFKRFPELYSDMPSWNHIPQMPSSDETTMLTRMRQRKLLPPALSPEKVQTGRIVQAGEDEDAKPSPPGGQYIPVETLHTHVVPTTKPRNPRHRHQLHHRDQFQPPSQPHAHQAVSDHHMYNVVDFNAGTAFDAFAYGTTTEADFATMYHAENLEEFQNMIF